MLKVTKVTKLTLFSVRQLNPITWGGGGLFGPDHQIIDHNLKRLNLAPPDLVTFSSYLLVTFWQNFNKINSPGGCGAVSEMRISETD